MDKYNKLKNTLLIIIGILIVIDVIISFATPSFKSNLATLILLGYAISSLLDEYIKYKTKGEKIHRTICIVDITIIIFCLYWISLNLLKL